MFSAKIINTYDSHLHWQSTGESARRLSLHHLKSPEDLKTLKTTPDHLRGDWLMGFGYDEFSWKEKPHRKHLDALFPNQLLSFVKVDGHATWTNTFTLKYLGIIDDQGNKRIEDPVGGQIVLGEDGKPNGILIDTAKTILDRRLPAKSKSDVKSDLLTAQALLHKEGYTHIRDMSCDRLQWEVVQELDLSGELKMYVHQNFDAEDPADYRNAFLLAKEAKNYKSPRVKPAAVKVYTDGSLGSESAWVTKPYPSGGTGLKLMDKKLLHAVLSDSWAEGLAVAIHTLGDGSVDFVVNGALELKEQKGITGELHLEHVELTSPDAIKKMKSMNITCHLQPSHFLSDQQWLEQRVGGLMDRAFSWGLMEETGVPFYFGSDSPIEPLSVERTYVALNESKTKIRPLKLDWKNYHSALNVTGDSSSWTVFENGKVKELVFLGEKLAVSK